MADERIKFYYQDKDGNVMGATDTAPSPDDKTVSQIVIEKASEENCFKTINGQSIIGQGDIDVGGGGSVTKYYLVSTDPADNPKYSDELDFWNDMCGYDGEGGYTYIDIESVTRMITDFENGFTDELLGTASSDLCMRIAQIFNGLEIECDVENIGTIHCMMTSIAKSVDEYTIQFYLMSFENASVNVYFNLGVNVDPETGDSSFVVSFGYPDPD